RLKVNAQTGSFILLGRMLDLISFLRINEATPSAAIVVALQLDIASYGVQVPASAAALEFDYRSSTLRGKGSFSFRKQPILTGAFAALSARTVQKGIDGFDITANGVLEGS